MSSADPQAQDLLGFLFGEFQSKLEEDGGQLTEAEAANVSRFIEFGRERLKTMAPQSLNYTEAGISLHLADGEDLLFIPAIADPSMNKNGGVDAMGAGLVRGNRSSTIQMGDYPVTGPKETRHVRSTQKREG